MSKPPFNFHESRDAFLQALHDYQEATLEMHLALQRMTQHTHALCKPLRHIVRSSGSMLAPRRTDL